MTSAEKKMSQRERIAAAGGATLTSEIGGEANKALQRALVLLDRSRGHTGKKTTKRDVLEAALVLYAADMEARTPPQRPALLRKPK